MTLARDQQKAFVVEGMAATRLESSDVRAFGKLTATEELAPFRIAGEEVLKGPLQFKIEGCTPVLVPVPGRIIEKSCTGQGTIRPTSSARGELGLLLLRIGDTGTCQGTCRVQQPSSVISSPVVCRVRIADSGQKATPPGEGAKKADRSTRRKKNQALMLRIAFRAFIHRDLTLYGTESGNDRCWSFEPWPFGQQITTDDFGGGIESEIQFRGDCRGFGEAQFGGHEVKSRVEHEIEVDANDIGALAASTAIIRPRIGKSHQRSRSRGIGRNQSEWTQWREQQAIASNNGEYSIRLGDEIEIVGQASYPFSRLAPSIDYRVLFTFARLDGKQTRIKYVGRHNLFPDYELVVNDVVVWKYVTSDLGPSPLNLTASNPFFGEVIVNFGAGGQSDTQVVALPKKCSTQFKLAMISGVSAAFALKHAKYLKGRIGAGVAVDGLFFQIWDTTNNLASIYFYGGAGIGVGFQLPWPHSATTHGPWNDFKTSAEMSCAQFEGMARYSSASVGCHSLNWINLAGTPAGTDSIYMPIETGCTFGAGISSTVGELRLLEGPGPFSGP